MAGTFRKLQIYAVALGAVCSLLALIGGSWENLIVVEIGLAGFALCFVAVLLCGILAVLRRE